MTYELSVKECVSFGWKTFKARPWTFIGASAIIFLLSMLTGIPRGLTEHSSGGALALLAAAISIICYGLSFLISLGMTAFYLRAHDDAEGVQLKELWHPHPYWKYIGTSLLAGAITVIGFLLLIIPGIIIGIMVGFATYLVVDKGLGPIAAIKESAALTKGNRWKIALLGLALVGINLLGLIALLVGLLVTIPISTLAVIHAYRELAKAHISGTPEVVISSAPLSEADTLPSAAVA